MDRIVKWVDLVLIKVLIFLTILIVLDVNWQVFSRFVLNDPSSFTEELASYLLIWIGLLGSAYALRVKAHLGIDILTGKFSKENQFKWEFFIYSAVIAVSLLIFIWGGIRLVNTQLYLNQISAALRIKVGYVYLVLPLTGILFIFYSVFFMIQAYQKKKDTVTGNEN